MGTACGHPRLGPRHIFACVHSHSLARIWADSVTKVVEAQPERLPATLVYAIHCIRFWAHEWNDSLTACCEFEIKKLNGWWQYCKQFVNKSESRRTRNVFVIDGKSGTEACLGWPMLSEILSSNMDTFWAQAWGYEVTKRARLHQVLST